MALRTAGVVLLAGAVSACSEPPYTDLNNGQLATLLGQGVPLYDIRLPLEWQQTGVIEGSRLMTFVDADGRVLPDFLTRFAKQTAKNEPVILICRTGNRTGTLARYLVEHLGYTQVYNVREGILQWIRDGGTVTRIGHAEPVTARETGAEPRWSR
jgi:rhodanese-related sulfurtransferase